MKRGDTMFDWSKYSTYVEVYKLKKNALLFRQGDRLNGFYYLQKGKVAISILREDGYERIIDFVFPGSLIGEQMINNTESFTTAKLLKDSTLCFISKDNFDLLIKEHPETSREFEISLISKIRMLANINAILNESVEVQLAHFLVKLHEGKESDTLQLTQTSIAKYLGKSRVSVWKVLKEWTSEGIIEINNQNVVIKNIDKLKEII